MLDQNFGLAERWNSGTGSRIETPAKILTNKNHGRKMPKTQPDSGLFLKFDYRTLKKSSYNMYFIFLIYLSLIISNLIHIIHNDEANSWNSFGK